MTAKWIATFIIACLSTTATAQERGGPPKWSVGAASFTYFSPFEAEKNQIRVVPYLSYRGDHFFIEGRMLGYHILTPDTESDYSLGLDLIASVRMLPGQSRSKVTADAGLRATLNSPIGSLEFAGLHDTTDTNNGMELSASYSYNFHFEKLMVIPRIGVNWQNTKMANYMWGVTQEQQDRMVEKEKPILPLYQPNGSLLNYSAGITALYNLTDRWTVLVVAQGTYLDKLVRDNPGINKKYDATLGLGLTYNF